MKLSHKVNDKFEYGNEDCKNTADIKLDADSDPVMCSKEEIKHSPYDGNMHNYSEVNFDKKPIEEKTVPKRKVMSSNPKDAVVEVPSLDMSAMMPVLLGMLGLGAMRTVEKTQKVSREK